MDKTVIWNNEPKSGVGYCQGMNYVAGLIILVLRDEEKSFWLLVCLLNEILPESKDSKCSADSLSTSRLGKNQPIKWQHLNPDVKAIFRKRWRDYWQIVMFSSSWLLTDFQMLVNTIKINGILSLSRKAIKQLRHIKSIFAQEGSPDGRTRRATADKV